MPIYHAIIQQIESPQPCQLHRLPSAIPQSRAFRGFIVFSAGPAVAQLDFNPAMAFDRDCLSPADVFAVILQCQREIIRHRPNERGDFRA